MARFLHVVMWHGFCMWYNGTVFACGHVARLLHTIMWHAYCMWSCGTLFAYGIMARLLHAKKNFFFRQKMSVCKKRAMAFLTWKALRSLAKKVVDFVIQSF